MNKNLILVFIVILVVAGAIAVIQQQQSTNQIEQMAKELEAQRTRQEITRADQAKQQALERATRAEAAVERIKQQTLQEARKIEEAAKQRAEEFINGLLAQAQSALNNGQYQEAVNLAQNILSQDPNNLQARSIMETAKSKLTEIIQQQEPISDSALPVLGQ